MYKAKLIKTIESTKRYIENCGDRIKQYELDIASLIHKRDVLIKTDKVLFTKDIEDINTTIGKLRKAMYNDSDRRNVLYDDLLFIKNHICPHENTEYVDTNPHNGNKEYRC